MKEQILEVGKFYILTEYNGDQYNDDIGKVYEILSETENYYKMTKFNSVGKTSLFMDNATFIEGNREIHPEYFL